MIAQSSSSSGDLVTVGVNDRCALTHVALVQVLYLLGAMSLSMALQLDRHGLWNLLGPSLFALGIMAVAWVRVIPLFPQLRRNIFL